MKSIGYSLLQQNPPMNHPSGKPILLFLLFTLPLLSRANQKIVPGYIISQNNDTILVNIMVDAALLGQVREGNLNNVLNVLDKTGTVKKLIPKDIKGFGFTYKRKIYNFLSKPIADDGRLLFVQALIAGPKVTVFSYRNLYFMASEDHFTFEKQDGTYFFISSYSSLETFRKKLKFYFKDNKETLDLIDKGFKIRGKLQVDMVKAINEVNSSQSSFVASKHYSSNQ